MDHSNHIAAGAGGKVTLSPLALIVLGIAAPILGSVVKDRLMSGESAATTTAQVQMLQERVTRMEDGKASKDELITFETGVRSDLHDLKSDLKDVKDLLLEKAATTKR